MRGEQQQQCARRDAQLLESFTQLASGWVGLMYSLDGVQQFVAKCG